MNGPLSIDKQLQQRLLQTALDEGEQKYPDRSMRALGGPAHYQEVGVAYAALAYNEGQREAFEFMRDRLQELFHYSYEVVPEQEAEESPGAVPADQYLENLNVRPTPKDA